MAVVQEIVGVFKAIWWGIRHGPPAVARWFWRNRAHVPATLWLAGLAFFIAGSAWRATETQRIEKARLLDASVRERKERIDREVAARLEGKPLPDAGSAGDGGPPPGSPPAGTPRGKVDPTLTAEEGGGGRAEIVTLMDVDEIENARGGSDEETREAISGLKTEYEGEDAGAEEEAETWEWVDPDGKVYHDGPDGGLIEPGKGPVTLTFEARAALMRRKREVKYEANQVPDGTGKGVTVRMKEGGLAGWVKRNSKYRKRSLGDQETLEVMAEVTGGVGTKINIDPKSPLAGLAAIAAIRGSAAAEAKESGAKVLQGSVDSLLPELAGGVEPTRATGTAATAPEPTAAPVPTPRGASQGSESETAVEAALRKGRPRPGGQKRLGLNPLAEQADGDTGAPPPPAPGRSLDLLVLGEAAVLGVMGRVVSADALAADSRARDSLPGMDDDAGRRALATLGAMAASGIVSIETRRGQDALIVPIALLFDLQRTAELTADGRKVLQILAPVLAKLPSRRFEVSGPTSAGREKTGRRAAKKPKASPAEEVGKSLVEGGLEGARVSMGVAIGTSATAEPAGSAIEIAIMPVTRAPAAGTPGGGK